MYYPNINCSQQKEYRMNVKASLNPIIASKSTEMIAHLKSVGIYYIKPDWFGLFAKLGI